MTGIDPLKQLRAAYGREEGTVVPFAWHEATGERLEAPTGACTHITLAGEGEGARVIFARGTQTNYLSKRGAGPAYALDAVCYLLERKDESYTAYLQEARRLGLTVVSLTDRKELVEYVLGHTDAVPGAALDRDAELPVPLPVFPESAEGRVRAAAAHEAASEAAARDTAREATPAAGDAPASSTASTCDLALARAAQTTASIFRSSRDFSGAVGTVRAVLQRLDAQRALPPDAAPAASSLLEQISSANRPAHVAAPGAQPRAATGFGSAALPWLVLVPAGGSALLTLHNAAELLEHRRYVAVADARALGPKPGSVRLVRDQRHFELVDNAARLQLPDWNRVIAAFVLGNNTWQFKGWRWEQPVELFQHILGFHLHYDDVALDPLVAGWNVVRLPLARNKRHLDLTTAAAFWARIDDFLARRAARQ